MISFGVWMNWIDEWIKEWMNAASINEPIVGRVPRNEDVDDTAVRRMVLIAFEQYSIHAQQWWYHPLKTITSA